VTLDITNFLLSLAAAIGPAADAAPGIALWVHQAPERVTNADSTAAYAVLQPYTGPRPNPQLRVHHLAIQCMAQSKSSAQALSLANRLYEALCEDESSANGGLPWPRSHWEIQGKKLQGAELVDDEVMYLIRTILLLAPPGIIGRDESGRWMASFNFEARFDVKEITHGGE
jgi:hypothetical protein